MNSQVNKDLDILGILNGEKVATERDKRIEVVYIVYILYLNSLYYAKKKVGMGRPRAEKARVHG